MNPLSRRSCLAHPDEWDAAGQLFAQHPQVTADILLGQHPIRAWEYTEALDATRDRHPDANCLDVGGAGSLFYRTLQSANNLVVRVDPAHPTQNGSNRRHYLDTDGSIVHACSLEESGFPHRYAAVYCLSVIEHIPQEGGVLVRFLEVLAEKVSPGGRLILTCDCGEDARVLTHGGLDTQDPYHFHWMRRWIACPQVLAHDLLPILQRLGLQPLGDVDFAWAGPTVYDYTVAVLALYKPMSEGASPNGQ